MQGGWCNDFYRSQVWYLDKSGKLSCLVGVHTYVLDWGKDKKLLIMPDEDSKSNRSWTIRENNKQQCEIQCNETNQVIDAANGSTDIRVSNANKAKNRNTKKNNNYHWSSSYDENWSTCWLLTDGNGSKAETIERGEKMYVNTNKIDINALDGYKRNALAHATFADEYGLNSVNMRRTNI